MAWPAILELSLHEETCSQAVACLRWKTPCRQLKEFCWLSKRPCQQLTLACLPLKTVVIQLASVDC